MPGPGCHSLKTRWHGACPAGGNAPFGGDRAAPGSDQEQIGRGELGADRIEYAFAEGAGKSLLGAEQHERRPGRLKRAVRAT
jgi:hypothetical protein